MKYHLLGSSAGKPVPRPFCQCRVCDIAREKGGRHLRTRTGMHIYADGDATGKPRYQIDMSVDLPHQMLRDGFDLSGLEHLIYTHVHRDHCDPSYLGHRSSVLSDIDDLPVLNLYGSDVVKKSILGQLGSLEQLRIQFNTVEPFQRFTAGELGIFPLVATHIEGSYNYVVTTLAHCVLIGWDTGMWCEETWEAVLDIAFDAVFLECTSLGPETEMGESHQSFTTMLEMRRDLGELGCITDTTPFILTHIGDNGGLSYDEQCELCAPHGVTVGYDSLLLDI